MPQGGNTGLVAGGVPLAGEVVVSLTRLGALGPVDTAATQVTAGAGVTLAGLADHAAAAGLAFGVDIGSRATATVGGMVATNAGGLHVVRYGAMRAQVVGVEAVLGTGEVVSRLAGLVKDNTGYDLAQLLCGSEGTLGIVTAARLRLVPPPAHVVTALVAVASIDGAVALAGELRRALPDVLALELMTGPSLRLVAEFLDATPPVAADAAAFLLVEVGGPADTLDALAAAVEAGDGRARRGGGHRATRAGRAVALAGRALRGGRPAGGWSTSWTSRCRPASWPGSAPTSSPGSRRPTPTPGPCCSATSATATSTSTWSGPPADDEAVDDLVLGLVVERGGSISAEHGIGTLKRRWLARDRSPAEVAAMRAVKRALDPDGILNPGVLFP